MRQIKVEIRSGSVAAVVRLAEDHGGVAPSRHPVERESGGWHRVTVALPNESVGHFVMAVGDAVEEADFVLPTSAALPVSTPLGSVRDRVADVTPRSTLELVLEVLQSIGTWKGMLLYAAVSGVVAAYAVIFGIPFLLTAAMLFAPLGAPVMVCVVAAAVGDGWMFRRGALRFGVALALLAAAAAALGLAYRLHESTTMMETLTNLSIWAGLLGVAGGAAGAQALVQAERDSLVTATATGFLVAVSLSPPSAVLGLAVAMGRWDYVGLMGFVLALTFAGILVGGWAALRFQGIAPARPSAGRGSPGMARGILAAAVLVLGTLVVWQARQGARYRKADLTRSATRVAREAVRSVPGYRVLTAKAEFTPGDARWHDGEGLLLRVVATRTGRGSQSDGAETAIRSAVHRRVSAELDGVEPFVEISIIDNR